MIKTNASLVATTDTAMPLCKCGCGQPVTNVANSYVRGHQHCANAVRSRLHSVVNGEDVILTQNLDIVQQMLGKFLNGKNGQNVINIITIGPIKIENTPSQNGPSALKVAEPIFCDAQEIEETANGHIQLGQRLGHSLLEQQRPHILAALQACDWSQKRAADKLGVSARRINYAVKRLGITHPNWRKNNATE